MFFRVNNCKYRGYSNNKDDDDDDDNNNSNNNNNSSVSPIYAPVP